MIDYLKYFKLTNFKYTKLFNLYGDAGQRFLDEKQNFIKENDKDKSYDFTIFEEVDGYI